MSAAPILPGGATIGILGGGQLGRMLGMAARRLGYEVAVYSDAKDGPAEAVASRVVYAGYDDRESVAAFARSVDVLTFEFESVPSSAAEAAAPHTLVRPDGRVLHVAQNRLREKRTLRELGVEVAPFAAVESEADLAEAVATVGPDGVLKSAELGYDGKSQVRIRPGDALADAWERLGQAPSVYEGFVAFECEASVVGARGQGGEIALFPCARNDHANHILDVSTVPAGLDPAIEAEAARVATTVLEGLDVVGVICIELFVTGSGVLVNEIAPRTHNSGHLTIEACVTSQFEQQVRAICGLPLGSPAIERPAAMANLLGELWADGEPDWAGALAVPGVRLHLYGKGAARPGRKMGHVTATADSAEAARERVLAARAALR